MMVRQFLLAWLIALFDTYYYPPVPDQGTRFKQTTIYMIIELFHPLNTGVYPGIQKGGL